VPSVCWRHAAPSCHACWQHVCRVVSACCVHFQHQTVVHVEQSAAPSREAGGHDRRNVISAAISATSRPVCDCRWGQPASIWADESAWRHLGPATDIREARHSGIAKSCNYHAQAIRHIRHLLTPELAQTLASSLILSRINYSNALLYGAPTGTIQKLQRVQNNAARIVLQMPRRSHVKPLLHSLHWLPVDKRIIYKMAVVTLKVQCTATPAYLSRHLQPHNPEFTVVGYSSAVSTFHQNLPRQTWFPLLSSCHLELTS